ncbi:unnamed protein product [Ectocarpus sp. 6 AP-2014]
MMSSEERMLVINRLHALLRPFMLRRVKTEVMGQLPEKVEKVLRCDLSGWQRALYKQIQESGAFGIAQEQGIGMASGKGLNNVFMQLRKVCNHPYLFFDDRWPSDLDLIRSSGKFELLDRMLPKLKAGGHRILMFTQMTRDRAHRIGQKHEVRVFRLVTDSPVEERIISRATDKLNMTGLVVEAGKFNRDSKAAERKAMLETLLREMDNNDEGTAMDDNGDTVINELMATTADELEQYQQIDRERLVTEAEMAREKGLRRWNRLMPADEAPAWLAPGAAAAAIAKAGGRGAAAAAAAAASEASGTGVGAAGGEWGGGDGPVASRGSRRKRAAVDYWDGLTDQQVLKEIKKAEDPEDGRLCCELYKKVPPRREFKAYYEVIENPIDLQQMISSRVRKGEYHTLAAFESDVMLLFDNAREYNVEGSLVYQDANTMQSIFSKHMADMYARETEWVVEDRDKEAAAAAAAAAPTAATSTKSGGGQRAKTAAAGARDGATASVAGEGAALAAATRRKEGGGEWRGGGEEGGDEKRQPQGEGRMRQEGEEQPKQGKRDKRRRVNTSDAASASARGHGTGPSRATTSNSGRPSEPERRQQQQQDRQQQQHGATSAETAGSSPPPPGESSYHGTSWRV